MICMGCMNNIEDGQQCSCGWKYDYSQEEQMSLLAPGTLLNGGNYMVGRKLGQGGYGVTYMGRQQSELGLKVAVKEYYPKRLAERDGRFSAELAPNYRAGMTQHDQEMVYHKFLSGKKSFIEEAKRLAELAELPTIVKVLAYFEENNTAYIVMEYINGIDLYHSVKEWGRTLKLKELERYVYPLMADLQKVHEKGIIHRDISPDNIMVTQSGSVKLIDFGAAVTTQEEENLKILRKNGFAPLEQYDETGAALGPWVDVYALCATIYYLLSGKIIPDARDRQFFDRYETLKSQGIIVPERMERVLKKGLAIDFHKRYQSVQELVRQLRSVRDRGGLVRMVSAACFFGAALTGMALCYGEFRRESAIPAGGDRIAQDILDILPLDEHTGEATEADPWRESADNYAVYDDLVYIRYIFDDGTIMLVRSAVGADNIEQVEYVTDGKFSLFCEYEGYLYLVMLEDGHLYRVDIRDIGNTADERQRLSEWKGSGMLKKVSDYVPDQEFGFHIAGEYVYFVTNEKDGAKELVRARLDGTETGHTNLGLNMTKCLFSQKYIYMTVQESGGTRLVRMESDGSYFEEVASFDGEIADMRIVEDQIYYLYNARSNGQDSCLGRISTKDFRDDRLAMKTSEDLEFCYMTEIVDNNNIYYTCSVSGTEAVNNLYCFSLENGSNKQISSECGRYIVTSDIIDSIIFASMDGTEIRKMNKDGSNPRVMRQEDGGTGITDIVDPTSLAIISDHLYYMDGESVAYKVISD